LSGRERGVIFRSAVVAAWLLVACFCASAQTIVETTTPTVVDAPIQYPSSAVSAGEEGTVLVQAAVDASGRVVDARLARSSGYPDLDAAALQSISGWSFLAVKKDGKPMAQWVAVPIRFQLQHEQAGASILLEALAVIPGMVLRALGIVLFVAGFFWSVILAKRQSILWLSGMVALWVVTYPLFVALHWSVAKRNLVVVSLGIALLSLGWYLAPS
jgi:protein TonB